MRWSGTAKALHWTGAALILGLMGLGWAMVHADMNAALRFDLYQLHKSFGFLALALALVWLRLMHLTFREAPPPPPSQTERRLVQAGRAGLWGLMILAPLSGWATASASPLEIPTLFFGLFKAPDVVEPGEAAFALASSAHVWLTALFAALVCLHVAAALKHHFIDRDDVLTGMLPKWRKRAERPKHLPDQRLETIK